MPNPSSTQLKDEELLHNVSTTFNREIIDFDELSYADIAVLLYSRALISDSDTLRVLSAGMEARNDIQMALVKQQQHEELISTLLSPGPIRYFSTSMNLPFDNIKQSYIEAVSNKRRLIASFITLPQVKSIAEIKEKSVNLTLSETEVPKTEEISQMPRYMTRASNRDDRKVSTSGKGLDRELRLAMAAMSHEQRANFTYIKSALEGEKASLDGMLKRKDSFLHELRQIANSSKSDIDFDRRMTSRISKGW